MRNLSYNETLEQREHDDTLPFHPETTQCHESRALHAFFLEGSMNFSFV